MRAIELGYVKELKGKVLNPNTLKYVRREDDTEIEVELDEVIRLGEEDADFRRSIVTSKETLNTIVDLSIGELVSKRKETNDPGLKIIASALNYQHCVQIVEEYRAKGLRADFVHSKSVINENKRILSKLNSHELDVIVQVRKLNEGFDHPYLSIAAVFSVFSNLSPFVQFVGRIMRVIVQNAPTDPLNKGVVIFHAGANITNRWTDFQKLSQADQEYYKDLLELEHIPLGSNNKHSKETAEIIPRLYDSNSVEVKSQSDISIREISLIEVDPKAVEALQYLQSQGIKGNIDELLRSIPATKVQIRKAKRQALHDKVRVSAGRIIQRLGLNSEGKTLDKSFRNKDFVYVVAKINSAINQLVGKNAGERSEFNIQELEQIENSYNDILEAIEAQLKENM